MSIVIPVYNGANFLAEAIDSALAQTYRNTEIIVVNDGSNDDGATETIIDSYRSRIRSFTKTNGGVASALNLGIREASGSFISWLSHDDEYLSGKIQSQVDLLAERDTKCVVYSGYHLINPNSQITGTIDPAELIVSEKLEDSLYPLMRMLIHGCTLLIPREAFLKVGMFDESLVTTQDYALWFEIFRVYGLVYDPNIFTLSRVHKRQSSKTLRGFISEGDDLWIGFMGKLTTDEMIRMSGSESKFYRELTSYLSVTPYRKAHAHAKLMKANAPKDLTDNDPMATCLSQFKFRDFGTSQRLTGHVISFHTLKLLMRFLYRNGIKKTISLSISQTKQYIKPKYLRHK